MQKEPYNNTYCTVSLSPRVLIFVTYSSRHFYQLVFVTYSWRHFLEYIIQFIVVFTVKKYYHTVHVVFMQKEPYNNTYCHTINVVIHRNSLHTQDTDNHTPESMSYFPHRNSLHTDGHRRDRHRHRGLNLGTSGHTPHAGHLPFAHVVTVFFCEARHLLAVAVDISCMSRL